MPGKDQRKLNRSYDTTELNGLRWEREDNDSDEKKRGRGEIQIPARETLTFVFRGEEQIRKTKGTQSRLITSWE